MPIDQLHLDGVAPAAMRGRRLTERQRDLLRFMRLAVIVGTRDVRKFYADPYGALRRLERLGLVQPVLDPHDPQGRPRWWTPKAN